MEEEDKLFEKYTRDKRRCMFFGQLLFVHGLFTAGWFILMIVVELSKTNIEDIVFVLMLVTAYVMGILYKNLKKKVKNSWTEYNKEKNRVSKLRRVQIKKEEDIKIVVD